MHDHLKLELQDLATKMNVLLREARRQCRKNEPTAMADLARAALDRIEMNLDVITAVTTNELPGPLVVRLSIPGSDEPVRLEAVWNDDLHCHRLAKVPIGLAVVARAIDASLANRQWSATESFSWSAIPTELDHMVES